MKNKWSLLQTILVVALVASSSVIASDEADSTPRILSHASFEIEYTSFSYPNYVWGDGQNHSTGGGGVHLALDWMPLANRIGKLGAGVGAGYANVSGVSLSNGGSGSITAYPLDIHLSYRFDYAAHQVLVPFVSVAGEWTSFSETTGSSGQTYYGLNTGVGLELCLNPLDATASFSMEHSIGIHDTYILVEYVKSSMASVGGASGGNLSRGEAVSGFVSKCSSPQPARTSWL